MSASFFGLVVDVRIEGLRVGEEAALPATDSWFYKSVAQFYDIVEDVVSPRDTEGVPFEEVEVRVLDPKAKPIVDAHEPSPSALQQASA
jgi:hypothetical protein